MREKHVITNGFTEKQTKWKGSVVAMRLTGLLRHDTELLRLLASNKATVCNLLGENGAYKMPGEMARRSTRFMAGIWVLSLALSGEHGRPCKTAFLLSSSPSLQEAGGGGGERRRGRAWLKHISQSPHCDAGPVRQLEFSQKKKTVEYIVTKCVHLPPNQFVEGIFLRLDKNVAFLKGTEVLLF